MDIFHTTKTEEGLVFYWPLPQEFQEQIQEQEANEANIDGTELHLIGRQWSIVGNSLFHMWIKLVWFTTKLWTKHKLGRAHSLRTVAYRGRSNDQS